MKTKREPLRITKIQKIIYTKAIVDKKSPHLWRLRVKETLTKSESSIF